MIQKLLVANRGEIACRVMRTARRLGIRTVAVYTAVDAQSQHVQQADEAVCIGAADAYLSIAAILTAVRQTNADAVHPGYGFLAENAAFAQACADAGVTFVGPTSEAIAAMGDKAAARQRMAAVGVPVVPGYDGDEQTDEALTTAVHAIGLPVMVKAAAGGGGKGMRLVRSLDELPEALAVARREAQQAFGSDRLLLERAIQRPRHVEVQVLGDSHGTIVHLGERDCSIQRRHQKVIEEAPAPGLSAELRRALGETAVRAAQAVHYTSAGTVEFLLDGDGRFYFLEMNTRIQVEHPVTELVTGLDLVAWQIRVAEGEALPWRQDDITVRGHAIEARLYAENPAHEHLPTTGQITLWRPASGEDIRIDSGVVSGDSISIHYDPMMAKVVAYGADRKTAVRRLLWALQESVLHGLVTNRDYLRAIVAQPAFVQGDVHTGFLNAHLAGWQPGETAVKPLLAVSLVRYVTQTGADHWRNSPNRPLLYKYQDQPDVYLTPHGAGCTARVGDATYELRHWRWQAPDLWLTVDGHRQHWVLTAVGDDWWVQGDGDVAVVTAVSLLPRPQVAADSAGSLRAPMPGVVLAVLVAAGDRVQKGQPLLKLEAMKMEHTIRSTVDGVVAELFFVAGDQVQADAQLLRLGAA